MALGVVAVTIFAVINIGVLGVHTVVMAGDVSLLISLAAVNGAEKGRCD